MNCYGLSCHVIGIALVNICNFRIPI